MAITLSQLTYGCDKTYDMQLLAGSSGLGNFVRWVHIVEDTEVPDFLHGNELIFVTGIGQQKFGSNDWLLPFVKKMLEKRAGGLCINIGPYIKAVPEEIIKFCEENRMPLFTLPWKVHLIDITYDFCHRIIASEEIEISLGTAFRNLIFSPENTSGYASVLERRGFHDDGEYTIAAIKLSGKEKLPVGHDYLALKYIMQRVFAKDARFVSMFIQDESFIMVFVGLSSDYIEEKINLAKQKYKEENHGYELRTGLSNAEFGYQGVKNCYQQAVAALKVAIIRNAELLLYSSTGIYRLLLSVSPIDNLRIFWRDALLPLEDYDQSNGTDYVGILREYLESNSSIQDVAFKKNVHRNTVNYQIKKIKEILNCEFDSEEKMNLLLAFYIKDLLDT